MPPFMPQSETSSQQPTRKLVEEAHVQLFPTVFWDPTHPGLAAQGKKKTSEKLSM